MTEKEPIAILADDIEQHPAFLAWQQIDGGKRIPQVIEVLQQHRRTSVYRLVGRTPRGWTIIAQRCLTERGQLERQIYEEILPLLPVSALHYHGCLKETGSHVWLFLEDAGMDRFSIADESHRMLAAEWLGTLHRSAQHTRAAQILPERGPAYYFDLMEKGREYIVQSLANPVMTPADLDLLRKILRQMDTLDSNWPELLKICAGIPQALVHGDFQPKNIYVKQRSTGRALYVMDWEMAGWGLPLIDIAPSSGSSDAQINLPVYLSMMQELWQDLDMPTLQYYIHVGSIFRRLATIYWASLELPYRWTEKPIQNMDIYSKELAHAIVGVFGKELSRG